MTKRNETAVAIVTTTATTAKEATAIVPARNETSIKTPAATATAITAARKEIHWLSFSG